MKNDPVSEISRSDLLKDLQTPTSASITDVHQLSSYNWIEAPKATPTIAVPGSPNLWTPPKRSPFQVPKDTGRYYISQNAARHPSSPLEPLFRALYISNPSFDIGSVDIVTDRNNIRKLLSLVNHRWSGKREDFTIWVEVTKNTAIFSRQEKKTTQYIGPNVPGGHGHSFEIRCTKNQVNRSTGHHRIISYNFGGLKLVVRHETDGFVDVAADTPTGIPSSKNNQTVARNETNDLASALNSLSITSESNNVREEPNSTPFPTSTLTILHKGQSIPLSTTLEIKTRVARRRIRFSETVAQLWISQTPHLVRAHHNEGIFADVPQVENVSEEVRAWEEEHQGDLRVLAGLISRIRNVVKDEHEGGRAMVRYDAKGDKLVFQKLEGKKLLPEDLYGKWEA